VEGVPALTAPAAELPGGKSLAAYIGPLVFGTLLSAVLALVLATPLAGAVALFITHYAPRRLAQWFGYLVDLLAAVPSIVFGLWGANTLAPATLGLATWLNTYLGWLPFFAGPVSVTGWTMLVVGVTLAVMILPIITAVSQEVFLQTPRLHEEAALALGATRWEMIRLAVLPFGRSGVMSGAMLGPGRALGETMAVAIILSASGHGQPDRLGQPVDDRREHRAAVPRLDGAVGERPDRVGPGAVPDHAAGQRPGPLHRQPPARVLRSQLMTIDTQRTQDEAEPRPVPAVPAVHRELPRWRPAALLVGALAVVGGVLARSVSASGCGSLSPARCTPRPPTRRPGWSRVPARPRTGSRRWWSPAPS
jgi:ABC-type phosphate transport system permease subunit